MQTNLFCAAGIMITALLAFSLIVVNDRFKNGVPDSCLGFQAATLLLGLWLISQEVFMIGFTILITSVWAGWIGLIFLWFEKGPNIWTANILPGLKR